MTVALKRSRIEQAKRVFLDRLTTDAQPLAQAGDVDAGPGEEYEYGGVYDAFNFGVGADCSGSNGTEIGVAFAGLDNYPAPWPRQFSTETFPGPFRGFRQVSQQDLLSHPYPIKVCIGHYGGGPDSHMNCCIDGWVMESNGDYGTCTLGHGAIPQSSDYWNDFWVYDSAIDEDTTWRQPMGYPKGFDYAGGRLSAAGIRQAGGTFVCRYLTDGGPGLPGKQLLPDEFAALTNGGVAVVFNYETTADFMLDGRDAGRAAAQQSVDYIHKMTGLPKDWKPVVYFSCDFDESPQQDQAIFAFCDGANEVLGQEPGGRRRVGMYGPYWILMRAKNAGKIGYMWQTEAWSGGNIDSRIDIMQRNGLGYQIIEGVQCDINEAHSVAFGQYPNPGEPATPAPPAPAPPTDESFEEWMRTASDRQLLEYVTAQLGPGDPAWSSKGQTLRDFLWDLRTPDPTKA